MKIPWRSSTEKNDNNPHAILDGPKSEPIDTTAHYFLLDKGCPGDTKSLVKFDGAYWRWIQSDKKWFIDQTITKEDWYEGHLQSITKEEAEKFIIPE